MAVGISLLVSSLVLYMNASGYPHPSLQLPAILSTLGVSLLVLWQVVWVPRTATPLLVSCGLALLIGVGFPLVRFIPPIYTATYRADVEGLFPPLWPYSVTIPLVLLLAAELMLPRLGSPRHSGRSLALALLAAALLLFFASVLVSELATFIRFFAVPSAIFWSFASVVGVTALLVLGAALPRKGMVLLGSLVLLLTGLFMEVVSISFYGGPPGRLQVDHPGGIFFPVVAFLAGTVPGALAVLAGLSYWITRRPQEASRS